MGTVCGQIRRRLLGISPEETTYERRGFRGATAELRGRLEQVGATFLNGYHAALEAPPGEPLAARLQTVANELRGFAYEGAAMGLGLLDCLIPGDAKRIHQFLRRTGNAHAYMVHVGVGWVWARVPWGQRRLRQQLDPLLSWLAYDGWGFHEGYFRSQAYLTGRPPPKCLAGYEKRAFDQGLGRCWWFVQGGNPTLISAAIRAFPHERQADMWSGIGLAATYAGFAPGPALAALGASAGEDQPALAQGSAFAAKARQRAGNLTDYTDFAVRTLCGLSASEAAQLCDTTLENLPANGHEPAYEVWRRRIQTVFNNHPSPPQQIARRMNSVTTIHS